MFMKRVCAFRRQPPKSRAQNLAAGSLQKIRIRNLHQVRRPPGEILRLNQKITVDRIHFDSVFVRNRSKSSWKAILIFDSRSPATVSLISVGNTTLEAEIKTLPTVTPVRGSPSGETPVAPQLRNFFFSSSK